MSNNIGGNIFILAAPSGAGKTSLVKALLEKNNNLTISTSHTTRQPRENEIDGEDYFFIQEEEFKNLVKKDYFIEHAKVFGNYYGTEKKIIEDSIDQGKDLLFDIDWQGAQQLREKMGEDVVSVFILPPSKKELEKRLKNRGQDSDLVVKNRMNEASSEITHWAEYDYLIINDNLDQSVSDVLSILKAERMKRIRQIGLAEFTRSIIDDA